MNMNMPMGNMMMPDNLMYQPNFIQQPQVNY